MFSKNLKIARGYKILKQENKLYTLNLIKTQLIESDHNSSLKNIYLNYNFINSNDIINQYLASCLSSKSFSYKNRLNGIVESILLYYGSSKPVIFPLPRKWVDILITNKISVNKNLSNLLFIKFIIINYLHNIKYLIKSIFTFFDFKNKIIVDKNVTSSFMFDKLNNCQFPENNICESHDIFSFYKKKITNNSITNNSLLFLHNNIKFNYFIKDDIKYHSYLIPPLHNIKSLLIFILWSIYIIFFMLYKLFIFEWWYLLLFEEIIKSKRTELAKNKLFSNYLFYEDWLYRPMWTYIAENLGSKISFYFYSTNSEGFKTDNRYKDNDFDWRTISWPQYLVWDEYQLNFIKKYAKCNPTFEITGPFYFQSNTVKDISDVNFNNSLIIFDVTPFRTLFFMKLGLEHDYYKFDIAKSFISDIVEVATKMNLKIFIKIKRKINLNYHDKRYINYLNTLKKLNYITFLEPEISPFHIIKKSKLSISFPFTSTSLIAKSLNKSTCYYDSSGLLYKDDKGSHGVNIISSKEELLIWLKNQ